MAGLLHIRPCFLASLFFLFLISALGHPAFGFRHRSSVCEENELDHPVIAIEFTLDYVASAAAYPDGTAGALAKVEGSLEYKALMRKWLQLCEDVVNRTKSSFEIYEEERRLVEVFSEQYQAWYEKSDRIRNSWSYWLRRKILGHNVTLPPPPIQQDSDKAISILTSMIETLGSSISDVFPDTTSRFLPCASLALPSFISTAHPRCRKEDLDSSDQDEELDFLPWLEPGFHNFFWYYPMVNKFSNAMARASRSLAAYGDDESNDRPYYQSGSAIPSDSIVHASRSLAAHDDGESDGRFYYQSGSAIPSDAMAVAIEYANMDSCLEHGLPANCDLSSTPPGTALAVSFSNACLSLYASRFGGYPLKRVPYNTFTSLGASALSSSSNKTAFWDDVSTRIKALLSDVRTRDSLGDLHRAIFLGDALGDRGLRSKLAGVVAEAVELSGAYASKLWLESPPDPVYAASMARAKEAREAIKRNGKWANLLDRHQQKEL